MDVQTLTILHIDRRRLARFDPRAENAYYRSAGSGSGILRLCRRAIDRIRSGHRARIRRRSKPFRPDSKQGAPVA